MSKLPAPVSATERIVAIDVLRGFAVLGILAVNIQSFGLVAAAYANPTAGGAEFAGADMWAWASVQLLADTKFISIFSMLFGAGMAMAAERAAARGVSGRGLHYRRQLWLLAIGLAHAYLVWYGDILTAYAILGMLLYPLRGLSARRLIVLGGLAVAVVLPLWGLAGLSIPYWGEAERAVEEALWAPASGEIAAETAAFGGGWTGQLATRAKYAFGFQTGGFLFMVMWRAGGLMLVGMGLYKLGVVAAARSDACYRRMAALGLGLGLPVVAAGIAYNLRHDFAWERSMFQGGLFNYVGSVGVFLGYVALVMLAVRRGWLPGLAGRLAAAGRMALTNYIAQSVICTFVFYGHGLGLFGRVGGPGRLGIAAAVWALQLLWSPWWLARFRFGPLEWLWRALSYGRRQPFRA